MGWDFFRGFPLASQALGLTGPLRDQPAENSLEPGARRHSMTLYATDPAYETPLRACHHADALDVLRSLPADSVDLVLTSPPFALLRRNAYRNVEPTENAAWFGP